jgi:hypothetical protein
MGREPEEVPEALAARFWTGEGEARAVATRAAATPKVFMSRRETKKKKVRSD